MFISIVGDDDGGKFMSEEEFEKYKQEAIRRRKDRVYVRYLHFFSIKNLGLF